MPVSASRSSYETAGAVETVIVIVEPSMFLFKLAMFKLWVGRVDPPLSSLISEGELGARATAGKFCSGRASIGGDRSEHMRLALLCSSIDYL